MTAPTTTRHRVTQLVAGDVISLNSGGVFTATFTVIAVHTEGEIHGYRPADSGRVALELAPTDQPRAVAFLFPAVTDTFEVAG